MKKLHFIYEMQIEYSEEISKCHFTIKCIPQDTLRQKIENISIELLPDVTYSEGVDGFRNLQIYGANDIPHKTFRFHIEGDATTQHESAEAMENEDLDMVFSHPYGLTSPGESIRAFYSELKKQMISVAFSSGKNDDEYENRLVEVFMHELNERFSYVKGATSVATSAEEAFADGRGVCQDYSHILITLLRLAGIPARYVTGFIIGEGESHAWVEYLNNGRWIGVDPTHDKYIDEDYIKIGHGRDAKDCMINRGIMHGDGSHTQRVQVRVFEQ